jgi:hypothetical protein
MGQGKNEDDDIAIFEDKYQVLHFIPCDESQASVIHVIDQACFCGPKIEVLDEEGEAEKIWMHQKILH